MENEKLSFWARNKIVFKAALIFILTLLLLIPTVMIRQLVNERQDRRDEVASEISTKWSGKQTLAGPILSIPYYEKTKDEEGNYKDVLKYVHILPDHLLIKGELFPEKRHRTIFEIVVYNSKLSFSGSFCNIKPEALNVAREKLMMDKAVISFGISDLRGIEEQINFKWNNNNYNFNPGVANTDVVTSGINVPISVIAPDTSQTIYNFSFDLNLKGSEALYFVPVGKITEINIASKWTTPSFDGAFLPDTSKVSEKGFTADWKVLNMNRNYPQQWKENAYSVEESAFGLSLLMPMDGYQKSMRSVKYAILLISLTFMIFFFIEILNNKQLHPFQYILVGLALCIFYSLLLSFSEHMNFNFAYILAGVLTIGLIYLYTRSILKDTKLSLLIGAVLFILYGFIFTIIQLEDYALLMGSIGLFIALALIMYYSRKIDWYHTGIKTRQ
jgi:inner membrane protein